MSQLVVIKHGSYQDVYNRLAQGGDEFYHAEKYWHNYIDKLVQSYNVTIIAINTTQHDVVLPNGVRSIGVNLAGVRPLQRLWAYWKIYRLLRHIRPAHTVVRNPEPFVFWITLLFSESLLPVFADSFLSNKPSIKYGLLKKALKSTKIKYICNHNIPACLSIKALGVSEDRIVPWDWCYDDHSNLPPREHANGDAFNLIYVGRISYGKGVADLIDAIALLNEQKIQLTIVGDGKDLETFKIKAQTLALSERISFLGKVRNAEVLDLMRNHDAVIVPSRHGLSEGLPVTIYEAFQSNTPLICSDHSMFTFFFQHGVDALLFKGGGVIDLAAKIKELYSVPETYRALSMNSRNALKRIICPNKLDQIITNWLEGNSKWFNNKMVNKLSKSTQ